MLLCKSPGKFSRNHFPNSVFSFPYTPSCMFCLASGKFEFSLRVHHLKFLTSLTCMPSGWCVTWSTVLRPNFISSSVFPMKCSATRLAMLITLSLSLTRAYIFAGCTSPLPYLTLPRFEIATIWFIPVTSRSTIHSSLICSLILSPP